MMEIGLSTASLFLKEDVENTFKIIKKLGCEVVEVFLTTFSEYKKEFADMLATRTEGLRIHSVHSLNQHFEPELFNMSPRTVRDAEELLREVLYCGKVLGASNYTFHGQARLKNKPYNVSFPEFSRRVEHICSICAEYDITLCYENVSWTLFSYPEFYTRLKEYSKSVRCTLDIKQAMLTEYPVDEYIKTMGRDINTVHLCGVKNGVTCMPIDSDFDFCTFFEKLLRAGVDAPLLLEVYSADYKTYDDLAASLDYLRVCLLRAKGEM
ncbi:MAG: sugar phosphate isomerase/epimerase [Clostridia bacterium]|nr:sugar phosphate isomerase/epimerase [Clostridia bacterium]